MNMNHYSAAPQEPKAAQKVKDILAMLDSSRQIAGVCIFASPGKLRSMFVELQDAIIEDLRDAQEIIESRAAILRDAEQTKKEMIEETKASIESTDMVKESKELAQRIYFEADKQSKQMVAENREAQQQLIYGIHEYADSLLGEILKDLGSKHDQVQQSRERVRLSLEEKMMRMKADAQ